MKDWRGPMGIFVVVFLVYWFSNPEPKDFYDYTFRIAKAFLAGELGIRGPPPPWLNEFVPWHGMYYSVFPLGAVLSVLPFSLASLWGWIQGFPGRFLAALLAGGTAIFAWKLCESYRFSKGISLMLTVFLLFGTWMWMNLTFAGAWHIALGFAVLGEMGALYFTFVNRKPSLCGVFFALAFGNRTEIVLLAPIFMLFLCRRPWRENRRENTMAAAAFCLAPFLLGVGSLVYNALRFSSPLQFGYALIPGVLEEPWYRHGIFSFHAIPLNAHQMLWQPWRVLKAFPYLVPTGFGGSIFLSSPFLLFLFRFGCRDHWRKKGAWLAIVLLTLVLWCHGNPGGWQFSYRYAMVLLPWMLVLFLEATPSTVQKVDLTLVILSVVISGYATYLFHFTRYVKP